MTVIWVVELRTQSVNVSSGFLSVADYFSYLIRSYLLLRFFAPPTQAQKVKSTPEKARPRFLPPFFSTFFSFFLSVI